MSAASREDATVTTRNGRRIGFAEYGHPTGKPLPYFHGHPGSRLEARLLATASSDAGVRLIGVDRPGMGLSDFQPGRRVMDWPNDVVEVADALQFERFGVVGFSGGGPFALACAALIPDRLAGCGIVSGVCGVSPLVGFLARWLPWIMLPIARRRYFASEQAARASLDRIARRWPKADRVSLEAPHVTEILAASIVESFRQGTTGAAFDGALLARAWGFALERVNVPIHLRHGELDEQVPVQMARAIAGRLPACRAVFAPGEGHISVIVNHATEIVTSVASPG